MSAATSVKGHRFEWLVGGRHGGTDGQCSCGWKVHRTTEGDVGDRAVLAAFDEHIKRVADE